MQKMHLTGKQAADQAERSSKLLIFTVSYLAFMANQLESRYLAEIEAN